MVFFCLGKAGKEVDKLKKKGFKLRPFVSLVLFLSFGLMVFSGLALYLRPEGSIARWTGWKMLGLDKKGWEGVHTFFCLVFFMTVGLHLVLNLNAFLRYLASGITGNRKNHRELIAAVGLVGLVLVMAVLRVPPASLVMDWRSDIKNGSVAVRIQSPEPDFEKRSLEQISAYLDVSVDQVARGLRKEGIKILKTDESLEEIARQNRTSPQKLYGLIISSIP
jgi:hypothetical protein